MSIECLHAGEDFSVVAARNKYLGAGTDSGLKEGEGSGREFVLFDLSHFIFSQFIPRFGNELLNLCVYHGCGDEECDVLKRSRTTIEASGIEMR